MKFIPIDKGFVKIDVNQFKYAVAYERKTRVFLEGMSPIIINRPLNALSKAFGDNIVSVSRTHCVNLEKVIEVNKDFSKVIIGNNEIIKVSRRHSTLLRKLILEKSL